jgi:hypothetical protein
VTKDLDDFIAEVTPKLGGLTSLQYVEAHPGEHVWGHYGQYESCLFCGIMRSREPRVNKPCRGIVRISLRDNP